MKLFLFGTGGSFWGQDLGDQVEAIRSVLSDGGVEMGGGEANLRSLAAWNWDSDPGSVYAGDPPRWLLTLLLPGALDSKAIAACQAVESALPEVKSCAVHQQIRLADGIVVPSVSRVGLMCRRPGDSVDEFWDHWTNRHMPLVLAHRPLFSRYVANRVIAPAGRAWDGVIEQWFESADVLAEHDRRIGAEKPEVAADIPRFVGPMQHFVARAEGSLVL